MSSGKQAEIGFLQIGCLYVCVIELLLYLGVYYLTFDYFVFNLIGQGSYNAGPYAWVQYVPGEPILPNRPNEGSVKRRNEKKRMRQHRAFILVCTRRTNYWGIEFVSICGWQRFFPCPKQAPAILITSSYTLLCSNCLSITPILKPKLAFPALYNLLQKRLY